MDVNAILPESHCILFTSLEEVESNLFLTAAPVGHSTNPPFVAVAASHDNIVTNSSIECACLVPSCGNGAKESHHIRLLLVVCGTVAEHLQGRLVNYVHTKLVATCTLRHRNVVTLNELTLLRVAHSTGSVVHRTASHTCERKCHIVLGRKVVCPFILLATVNTLRSKHVGVSACDTCGLVRAMVVNEQLELGSTFSSIVVPLNHPLVVTLHKVNLKTLYAPLFELGKSLVHLLLETQPCHPQDDAHVLLFTVTDKLCEVNLGNNVKNSLADVVPTLVENNILDAVSRCKVDEIFVSLSVYTATEVNACE